MIDLKKLEKINNEILDNENDKKFIITSFKNLLVHLYQIESQFEKTYEVAENLDLAIKFIHQITRKSNKEFTKKNLIHSTEKIKRFIEVRKDLIEKALNKLESKEPLCSLIQTNFKTLTLRLDNELSMLKVDIYRQNEFVLRQAYNATSAYGMDDMDKLTYLFFDNFNFTQYIEYVEKKLNDKGILNEICTEYPSFPKDLKDTLDSLYGELNESSLLIQNYVKIATSIGNIYKKYYNI